MNTAEARYAREKEFHDNRFSGEVRKDADKYYSVFSICNNYISSFLNENSKNKKVLEYGCGEGTYAFTLSRNGAMVTGIDISDIAIEHAKKKAEENKLSNIDFIAMNAEELKFENNSFDLVCGTAILHHLDLKKAYPELARVMKADAKAVFMEPLGHNPFINFYRSLTPAMRTEDEHPLFMKDIKLIGNYFSKHEVKYFHLLSLLAVPFRNTFLFNGLLSFLNGTDQILFTIFPFLKRFAWYVVIIISEPASPQPSPKERG